MIAAAASEHPLAAHAVAEAVGSVLDRCGPKPDLAVVLVAGSHVEAVEEITETVHRALRPRTLVGAAAASVLAGHVEIEQRPAVVVWAARVGRVEPVRITVERRDGGTAVSGLPRAAAQGPRTLVLLGDPATLPAEPLLDQMATSFPALRVVGGTPAGVDGPGACRLILDAEVVSDGAVGVLLDPATDVEVLVSPGCLPVGAPMVVTRGEGGLIHELAGRPALERVREVLAALEGIEGLDRHRARHLGHGLQIGRVVDERLLAPRPGDFLVRDVAGIDPATGSVAVADHVEVGQSVQLFVRDAVAADVDLRARLRGIRADGVLVFNSAARGSGLFGFADHDADVVATALGTNAVAGLTVGGQFAPLGGRSFVQRHSLAALVFGARLAPEGLSGLPADAG